MHQYKILVVSWNALGDTIMATPALRALRKGLPKSHLAFSCHAQWADLFRDASLVDEIITVNRRSWKGVSGWFRRMRDLNSLAGRDWDIVLDLGGGSDVGRLFDRVQPRLKAGAWHRPGKGLLVPPDDVVHQVDRFLGAALLVGGKGDDRSYQLSSDLLQGGSFCRDSTRPRFAINPGAAHPTKRWPVERFREVVSYLRHAFDGEISVLWGPGEREVAEQIAGSEAALAPPTSPAELAVLLQSFDLMVSGDTGPMHLAAAVGCPVVALFSTADPAVYLPPGRVTAVRHQGRIDGGGMSVESVIEAIESTCGSIGIRPLCRG